MRLNLLKRIIRIIIAISLLTTLIFYYQFVVIESNNHAEKLQLNKVKSAIRVVKPNLDSKMLQRPFHYELMMNKSEKDIPNIPPIPKKKTKNVQITLALTMPVINSTPHLSAENRIASKLEKIKTEVKAPIEEPNNSAFLDAIVSIDEANKIKEENSKFDKFCDEVSNEWESIGNFVFIKRSGGHYFYKEDTIRLHMLVKSYVKVKLSLDLTVELLIQKVKHQIKLDETSVLLKRRSTRKGYSFVQMDAQFFLSTHLENVDYENIIVSVIVKDAQSGLSTKREIVLETKILEIVKDKLSESMICSKCLSSKTSEDAARRLRWWIEINKQFGYSRISICNHSIENDPKLNSIFENYKGMLTVSQLKCLPNLLNENSKYIDSNLKLVNHATKTYNPNLFDIINQLIINDCYFKYVDKYKFISVMDPDEAIIPKLNSNYTAS